MHIPGVRDTLHRPVDTAVRCAIATPREGRPLIRFWEFAEGLLYRFWGPGPSFKGRHPDLRPHKPVSGELETWSRMIEFGSLTTWQRQPLPARQRNCSNVKYSSPNCRTSVKTPAFSTAVWLTEPGRGSL